MLTLVNSGYDFKVDPRNLAYISILFPFQYGVDPHFSLEFSGVFSAKCVDFFPIKVSDRAVTLTAPYGLVR